MISKDENSYAIECAGLTMKFGSFTAVNSLNLKVKTAEIFGLLGPNGAGKTTTMKMLTTLLIPTSGNAKVASYDLRAQPAFIRGRIGIVPQQFSLFDELTPLENLWYIGELYNMERDVVRARSEELLKTVQLFDKKDVPCEGFSGGMKQRLSVAAGLLHTPKILFMDEPTTGLDPQSRIAIRDLTKELNSTGITIIYTTHDMEEADKLCDRIAIIDAGKVMALGTSKELKDTHGGGHIITIEVDHHTPELTSELKKLANASSASVHENTIELRAKKVSGSLIQSLAHFLEKKKVVAKELRVAEPSLESVFINLTKKTLRD